MGAVGTIDSISPIDRLTARFVEWSIPGSGALVKPQGVPHDVPVGRRPQKAEPSDSGNTGGNREESHISVHSCYLRFVVDHESNEVTVKVIDRASGEIVRTIPPEELARCAQELRMAPGTYLETLL